MLWEKSKTHSMFIDILKNVHYPLVIRPIYRKKKNSVSISLRNQGNELYKRGDFEEAWTKYNESVSFAESASECMALAYSNRSQCFLKLKMYERCSNDIQIIKEQCSCPESLLPKLNARQQLCVEKLDSPIHSTTYVPTLNFEPDHTLPNMSSALKIESDPIYGRMIRAKFDLGIGQTILIEKDYIRNVIGGFNDSCMCCGKKKMNFIPCENCADAVFCNKECVDGSSHKLECGMDFGTDDLCDQQSLTTILRSVLIGISLFTTVDELMEFIENCRSAGPFEITTSVASAQSQYRTFFNLSTFATSERVLNFRRRAYFVFKSIMASTQHAHKFNTVASQRFLCHLIIHHGLIINTNSFSFDEDATRVEELVLIASYLNHSCLPNVAKLTKDNMSIIKTILPIKQGEQIFVTYISDEVFDMTREQRNSFLNRFYGFECKCRLCTSGRLFTDNLFDDPSFTYVSSNVLNEDFANNNLSMIIQHCIEFLQRHEGISGSKEIAYIADTLTALFSKQLNDCIKYK